MSFEMMALRMKSFAVAMQAKCGAVDPKEVDALWQMANERLERNDPFLSDISDFCREYPFVRFNARLVDIGNALAEAVVGSQPSLPVQSQVYEWQLRRDING